MFLQKVDQCVFLQKVGQRMFFAKSWPLLNYTTSAWLSILVIRRESELVFAFICFRDSRRVLDQHCYSVASKWTMYWIICKFGGHWMKMWNVAIPCERQSEECASSSKMPNTKTNWVWVTIWQNWQRMFIPHQVHLRETGRRWRRKLFWQQERARSLSIGVLW